MPPLTRACAAAEAPPSLLDALARAPAAAALVVAALEEADDRKALRLVHTQLRDVVGEVTWKLEADLRVAARPPTARRWPRLEELAISYPNLAATKALGSGTWAGLRALSLGNTHWNTALGAPAARALAAALRRMPALRALELRRVQLPAKAAQELFRASRAEAALHLRALTMWNAGLAPAAARILAASGWRLEALDLTGNRGLGAAGVAALGAAPSFLIRRLNLGICNLDAASLLNIADAPWPLEELALSFNDFSAAAVGPALAALSRLPRLRRLDVSYCELSAANFKALVEAAWPALMYFSAVMSDRWLDVADYMDRWTLESSAGGPDALGAAAFAGFPALEVLDLSGVALGEAGAALLASRRWARLKVLQLDKARLGDAGVAALARGAWPALEELHLSDNHLGAPPTLEDARRWAPALVELRA